jgi:hypothetical protein
MSQRRTRLDKGCLLLHSIASLLLIAQTYFHLRSYRPKGEENHGQGMKRSESLSRGTFRGTILKGDCKAPLRPASKWSKRLKN